MQCLKTPIPRRTSNLRFVSGFTMLELMITITIIAIGLSLAVPSIRDTMANNQVAVANNSIVSGINLARSEAITRGNAVAVCPSNTGNGCNNGKWNRGWIVFDDTDGNATLVTAEIIRVNSRNETVNRTGFAGTIVFQPDGTTTLGTAQTMKICYADTGVTNKCRSITISRFGSVSSQETTG
ncbi:MAG: GspH/FimT family pseudopilin [Gammaproteobacteria bacterium]|nr:MAG: GspH/FimT family pseudopilin [Gammaproteobacteria bacterium]